MEFVTAGAIAGVLTSCLFQGCDMASELTKSQFAVALTQAQLQKIPPELHVATAHDDEVMLYLLHVPDADATAKVLTAAILLSESRSILETLELTGGLIRKRFHIDRAYRIRAELESTGAVVEFVRPDDGDTMGS